MKISLIKLLIFLLIVLPVILYLKTNYRSANTDESVRYTDHIDSATDTSYYFIGSSRVQRSIDPEIIQSHYNHPGVFNVGIAGSSFLSNCIMADYLARKNGYKVLFIELAPLVKGLPINLLSFPFCNEFTIPTSVFRLTQNWTHLDRVMFALNTMNLYAFHEFNVTQEVQNLIGYKTSRGVRAGIGFATSLKNDFRGISTFLKFDEINKMDPIPLKSTEYREIIIYLTNLAASNNTQIVFFLPITYMNREEKEFLLPLFSSLPSEMKLDFSASFLKEIAKEEYLMDGNHLNQQGARAYSTLLLPLLKRYFKGNHSPRKGTQKIKG